MQTEKLELLVERRTRSLDSGVSTNLCSWVEQHGLTSLEATIGVIKGSKNINANSDGVWFIQIFFQQLVSKYCKKRSITFFLIDGETVAQSSDLVTVIQLAASRARSKITFLAHAFLSLKPTQLCQFDFSQCHSKI